MISIINDFNLRPCNTFGLDAVCRHWYDYSQSHDIPAVISMIERDGLNWFHFGEGSNLLIATDRYEGAILHSSILTLEGVPLSEGRMRITAGAGLKLDRLCEYTAQAGLWGLENLSAIPGQVGASAVQNVGAYGCEAADLIESVLVFDTMEKKFLTLSNDELGFSYRMSIFKHHDFRNRFIVAEVSYVLSTVPKPRLDYGNLSAEIPSGRHLSPMAVREAVIAVRARKLPDPDEIGSAGSFFKNPVITRSEWITFERKAFETLGPGVTIPHFPSLDGSDRIKLSAAWLIDKAGCKTLTAGGAAVWNKQPLVLVNASGKAVWQDIDSLSSMIIDTVFNIFGIRLTPEVERVS